MSVNRLNNYAIYFGKSFVRSFLPPQDICILNNDTEVEHVHLSTWKKTQHYMLNAVTCPLRGSLCAILGATGLIAKTISIPFQAGSSRLKKQTNITHITSAFEQTDSQDIEEMKTIIAQWIPDGSKEMGEKKDFGTGFATSVFQDCGVGTRMSKPPFEGRCNWDKWIPDHIKMENGEDKFINYLDYPQDLVNHLKESATTSFRLSLERSIIEPIPGKFSQEAIEKYKKLIHLLRSNDIDPLVTLHHFVNPEWFEQRGGFENEENIDNFVNYCAAIMEEFKDDVKCWMTFNELAVYVFQTYIRKVYPRHSHKGISLVGPVLRNLLIAHIKIYRKMKDRYEDELQIGFTHQWLKFIPHNSKNPIENLVCYYLSYITHQATFSFFQRQDDNTYRFELKTPGSNVKLIVPDDGRGITDFIGCQHYGFPLLKFGLNNGQPFPGHSGQVVNLTIPKLRMGITIGAACKKGGVASSFGPPFSPETLIDVLIEARRLNKPLVISETGFDKKVQHYGRPNFEIDETTQKKAYEIIFSIIALARCKNHDHQKKLQSYLFRLIDQPTNHSLFQKIQQLPHLNINLKGVNFWTLFKNFEWENGWDNTGLDLMDVTTDKLGRIASYRLSLAGEHVKEICLLQHMHQDKSKKAC